MTRTKKVAEIKKSLLLKVRTFMFLHYGASMHCASENIVSLNFFTDNDTI